jgi:protein involved in polysaccharide export with SLBB domain
MCCRFQSFHALLCVVGVLLSAAVGCTNGRLPINTATHRLLDSTKEIRAANPAPMPLPKELEKGVLLAHYVEPGDTILVQAANLDSPVRFPTDQVVPADGRIELGKFGRLQVVGKTVDEIEAEVQRIVSAKSDDAGPITVSVVGRSSKVFYVLGEVNSPGAYPLVGRENVLDAIIAAGGLTDAADVTSITYTQPTLPEDCRVVLPVCYREIVQLGDTSTNYQIAPGDRIYVPSMTLCQQLGALLHPTPRAECPPCGGPQCPAGAVAPQHIPPAASPQIIGPEVLPSPKGKR